MYSQELHGIERVCRALLLQTGLLRCFPRSSGGLSSASPHFHCGWEFESLQLVQVWRSPKICGFLSANYTFLTAASYFVWYRLLLFDRYDLTLFLPSCWLVLISFFKVKNILSWIFCTHVFASYWKLLKNNYILPGCTMVKRQRLNWSRYHPTSTHSAKTLWSTIL